MIKDAFNEQKLSNNDLSDIGYKVLKETTRTSTMAQRLTEINTFMSSMSFEQKAECAIRYGGQILRCTRPDGTFACILGAPDTNTTSILTAVTSTGVLFQRQLTIQGNIEFTNFSSTVLDTSLDLLRL